MMTFSFTHLSYEEINSIIATYLGQQSIADEMLAISVTKPVCTDLPPVDWSDRYGWCVLTIDQIQALRTEFWRQLTNETKKRLDDFLGGLLK